MHTTDVNEKTGCRSSGFTLIELSVAAALMVLISVGVMSFYILLQNVWHRSTMTMSTSLKACAALNRVVYGTGIASGGLRAANGSSVWQWSDGDSYFVSFNTNRWYWYDGTTDRLIAEDGQVIAKGVNSFTGMISNGGIELRMSLIESAGPHTITGAMSTFVLFRN